VAEFICVKNKYDKLADKPSTDTFPGGLLPVLARIAVLCLLLGSLFAGAQNLSQKVTDPTPIGVRLPNGRKIDPQGTWHTVAPYPFALAVRPDGQQIVLPAIGWPFSLNIIDHPDGPEERITRIPATSDSVPDVQVHAGVAYSPDGRFLYDATGDSGAVDVLSTEIWKPAARIELNGPAGQARYSGSFASNLLLSRDGRFLYVVDQGNWRIVVFDTADRQYIASIPTGANPLALALSDDGKQLYFTNSGLFEYKVVEGVQQKDLLNTGLHFPPFAYPSKQARRGSRVEGHRVPGLGKENDVRGSSLWTCDVSNPAKPVVVAKLRLGSYIGSRKEEAVGGASPSGVIADAAHVYVTLSHEDAVAVVSPDGKHLLGQIALTPFEGEVFQDRNGRPLRGVMPVGIAQDDKRLYVTEAGINALAVIEKDSFKVLGHVGTGWYPSAVALSPDQSKVYVVNTKGKGSGPNLLKAHPEDKDQASDVKYIAEISYGSLSSIPRNTLEADLATGAADIVRHNQAALLPDGKLMPLKHVFLIIRENRTFDDIFGDLPGADGDPGLARYGIHGWTSEDTTIKDVRVTPNAHALAQRFATSDRFFVDSDVSADGHRWALGIAPTPWMNEAWTSGYSGRREGNAFSSSPGRRAMTGGADAPMPEDEPQYGSLWEHVANAGLSIRNYGEGLEVEGSDEEPGTEPEGHRLALNAPVPKPVFESTDRRYPTFNLGIPDQFRYEEFSKDMDRLLGKGKIASLTVIRLPNDHTAAPRPKDGYPFRASYVADNDLALGKIMEKLSHSPIWKETAVFVIEDDAQDGGDHVDAHRSVLLVMSPYVRSGLISHRHCSMPSVQKTIYELLGVGPLNLEDALAADMSDMFTSTPDLSPFSAEGADARIFDPVRARFAHPKTRAEAQRLRDMDDPAAIQGEFHRAGNSR
jgi:YVTN family beta-propeller protein